MQIPGADPVRSLRPERVGLSYTSSSVAWDVENMSDENMLQDAKIISVILAFQNCRGMKSINSTVSTEILRSISFAHR